MARPLNQLTGELVGVLAALLALYSAGLLYEGWFCTACDSRLTWPYPDAAAMRRAYVTLAPNAPAAARTAAAEKLARADPVDPESWNAMAYADWFAHAGRLSPAGVADLARSYAVELYDAPAVSWRIAFAFENWPELTPAVREKAIAEAKIALDDDEVSQAVRNRLLAVQDPAGRLAARLVLDEAKS